MGAKKGFKPTESQVAALQRGRRRRNAKLRELGPVAERTDRVARVRNGDIPVASLTDEEVAKGNIRLDDGTWAQGRLPAKLQGQMQRELYHRARVAMQAALPRSIEVAHEIMTKGKKDADRLRAVELFQDRTLGRVPQHVAVHTDAAWEDTFEGVVWAEDAASEGDQEG